jgi:serine/threonine-protein kinase
VTLVVSSGAGSVVVPDVLGQPSETAIGSLTSMGLDVNVVKQEVDDESDDDRVLDQAPASGTRVHEGDEVTIFVGKFTEPRTTTTLPTPDQEVP